MKKVLKTILIIILMMTIAGVTFATTGTVTTNGLNLRESASASANVITSLSNGTTVNIVGEDGNWYKITYQNYTGYVSKDYLNKNSDDTATTSDASTAKTDDSNTDSSNASTSNSNIVTITEAKTTSDAQVYILPLINSTKLSKINSGDDLKVVSLTGKWAYIQDNAVSGWVLVSKLNIKTTEESNTTTSASQDNNTNVSNNSEQTASANNSTSEQTASANNSTSEQTATVNTTSEQTTAQVNTTNSTQQAADTNSDSYPKTMYVNVDSVFIRTAASKTSEILNSAKLNDSITVTGKSGDWYKIKINGDTGYILAQYLSTSKK